MNRLLVLLIVFSAVLSLASASRGNKPKKGRNKGRGNGGQGSPPASAVATDSPAECGDWEWGECVPKRGDCGKGTKTGSRTGEGCTSTTTTETCRVKCARESATEGESDATTGGTPTVASTQRGKGKNGKGQRGGRKQNKPEKTGKPNKAHKQKPNCKYSRATLSDCDPQTGRQNKTRVLKSGHPSECEAVLVHPIRCFRKTIRKENRRCNYTIGEWGACDTTTNRRYRVDTLTDPSQASDECRLERTLEKPCPPEACEYSWTKSECNSDTNEVTLSGTLLNGETAPHCDVSKTKTMPCTKKNGKEKCKFGEWEPYGECINGMKARTREVRKGGRICNLLAKEILECQ